MKYLGNSTIDRNLGEQAFSGIVEKMRIKLQPWTGKHLPYGGRLMLTNSSLTSLPTCLMGVFLLHE